MTGGGVLKVDPGILQKAGMSIGAAGDALAGLQPEGPLADAALSVPALATGSACRVAQAAVAAELSVLADGVQGYGQHLLAAANRYQTRDQTAAEAIDNIEVPM